MISFKFATRVSVAVSDAERDEASALRLDELLLLLLVRVAWKRRH
jgi:hypothetical protein